MSVTLNKINTSNYNVSVKNILYRNCKIHEDVNKLMEVEKFFNSQFWQDMKNENIDKAHLHANDYLKYHLGSDNFVITNNGISIYGNSSIVANFNDNHKVTHDYLDNNKIQGVHYVDGLIMIHIGSVLVYTGLAAAAVISHSGNYDDGPFIGIGI